MVFVRLWAAHPSRGIGPHGLVHIDCGQARNHGADPGWRESASEHTADRELPDYTLYWCIRRQCFGPDNPRPFPRHLLRG